MRRLGIIAGNGNFPLIFAEQAKLEGISLVAVAHRGETPDRIERLVDAVTWVRVGELGKIIRTFHKAGVEEAVLVGGIGKAKLFSNFRPDLRGAAFLVRMRGREDDQLLRGVARELEGEGIRILASTLFLSRIIPSEGVLTQRSPTSEQWEDVRLGIEVAKAIGQLGVGQGVVVKERVVLAVEAIEGTDATIRRGGDWEKVGSLWLRSASPSKIFALMCLQSGWIPSGS